MNFKYIDKDGNEHNPGGDASLVDGVISTRRGILQDLIGPGPEGEWKLDLSKSPDFSNLFKDEAIEDILFVITYKGDTPEWPK